MAAVLQKAVGAAKEMKSALFQKGTNELRIMDRFPDIFLEIRLSLFPHPDAEIHLLFAGPGHLKPNLRGVGKVHFKGFTVGNLVLVENIENKITAVSQVAIYILKDPFHIGKIMSGLKLPHFKITGKFSLNPPSTPHIGVDWYAKGGIFDKASVIGVGEAGPEAVVPLDKFWDKLDNMSGGETNITININGSNKDPKEIAEEVKRVLIQETNRRRLAWQ